MYVAVSSQKLKYFVWANLFHFMQYLSPVNASLERKKINFELITNVANNLLFLILFVCLFVCLPILFHRGHMVVHEK